ncbi:hypothetical protein QFZ35_000790 [Arthrobacter ulcerisalmonis]|uniref:O-antigen ligase family protein n=1 Tax=Arthrobacter sp. B1I2 TaxID=3042263 RepID=UPI002783207A|nr:MULTISPECIES: O-antigen ligase family protein [Arthrobacter]MDQ0662292.1 hypothetical protein [Arthrobacter ulcerisalmonis]MDQ0730220.1 hypothetical protein [Arthrobacter sp. B1I2]
MGLFTEALYLGVGFAAVALGLVAALTHPGRRNILAFLLGISAGLVAVQIFRVHIFTLLAVAWVFLPGRARNRSAFKLVAALLAAALLLASTTLSGDLVNSPTLGLQLLGLAGSAALVALTSTRKDATAMMWGLLAVSTVGSGVGVLQVFQVIPMDLWHLHVSSIGRPTGIYPEPDWLGMFSGMGVLLSWRLPMSRPAKVGFFLPNIIVFVLAMARASWIALLICVAAAAVASMVHRRRGLTTVATGPRRGRRAAIVVASVAAVVALSAVPQLQEEVAARASTMLGTVQEDDISGQARIRQNDSLVELARSIPVYGHGLSSAGRVGVWGQIDTVGESQNNVASNWVLGMWVDGALFAVPLMVCLIGLALVWVRSIPGQLLLFTLVCSLFSNAIFFPVTWLLVGLAIIAAQSNKEALPRPRHRLDGMLSDKE